MEGTVKKHLVHYKSCKYQIRNQKYGKGRVYVYGLNWVFVPGLSVTVRRTGWKQRLGWAGAREGQSARLD